MAFNTQAAMQAGYSPQEIQAYLGSKGSGLSIDTSQPSAPTTKGNLLTSLLPLGGSILGGIAGIPLGPAGVVGGGAAGGALGEAGRQYFSGANPDVGSVVKEGALGGIGGLLPELKLFKILGLGARGGEEIAAQAAEKGGGSLLSQGAERLATAANRISPSQFVNLKDTLGVNPGRFLLNEDLVGKSPEAIQKLITPLQTQFTNLAEQAGVNVDPATVFEKLATEHSQLANTTGKAAQSKANALEDAIGTFINKYGDQPTISIKDLNREAINVGKQVSDFNTAGIERSADRILRDAYRSTIQDTTSQAGLTGPDGSTLKEMGDRLHKLYELEGVATKQSGIGQGAQVAGITGLLGAGIAGPGGGIGGAALGFGATKLLQNPKVLAFLAKNADRLAQSNIPEIAALATAQAGLRVPQALNTPNQPTSSLPQPDNSQASLTANDQVAPVAPQDKLNQVLGMYALTHAKSVADIVAATKLLSPQTNSNTTKITAKDAGLAKSGLRNIQDVQKMYSSDPSVLAKQLVPGQFASRAFDSALYDTADALLRLRTGAQANPAEIRGYMQKIAPVFGDSPEVVKYKLNKLSGDFQEYLNATGSSPTIPLPSDYSGLGL